MIYNKSNRTNKQTTAGLSNLCKGTVPVDKKNCRSDYFNLFEAASKFYSAVPGSFYSYPMKYKNCFAIILAGVIVEKAGHGKIKSGGNSMFSEDFYSVCADEVMKKSSLVEDRELIIIYLKQSVHMLENCGILFKDNDSIINVKDGLSDERVYRNLLNSFWNSIDWKTIFPSSPESAASLHQNRELFAELICGYYGPVNIEELSNDFFDLTEITVRNDNFMISFIDFYLLTWLKHFGIIEYHSNSADDIVYVSLTESGRPLLKSL
jgi:hypothetical protein